MTNITFELELQISAFYRKPVKTFSLNMVDAKQRMGSRNGDSDDPSEISRTSAAATRFEDQAIRLVLWDGKGKLRTSVYLDGLEKKTDYSAQGYSYFILSIFNILNQKIKEFFHI